MAARLPRILLLLAALAPLVFLAGCGGGGGEEITSDDGWVIDGQLFTPNYVSDLDGALYHWNHLAMRTSFTLPADWATLYGGQPLEQQAADEWNGAGVTMIVVTSSSPDTTVVFVENLPGNTLGQTSYTYSPVTGRMADAEITIALEDSHGVQQSADDIRAVIAHELGHALGIGGHSTTSTDLMYPSLQTPPQSAGIRDLNTMKTAYPAAFGVPMVMQEQTRGPEQLVTKVIECSHDCIFGTGDCEL